MDYNLLDLETVLRLKGRGVAFYAHDGTPPAVGNPVLWDFASELNLAPLGDTEGDIVVAANGSIATLTLPEISGDAIHEATYTGDNPTVDLPIFFADPDLFPLMSPTGQRSAGHSRVRDTAKRTIVIFPENLFRDANQVYQTLSFAGGSWTLNGSPLDAAHQTLLEMSLWIWRGYFDRPDQTFLGGHGDDGKNIQSAMLHATFHPDAPDGHRLYTIGNPFTAGIDLEGGS